MRHVNANCAAKLLLGTRVIGSASRFFFCEWPRNGCYGRTAALRLILQPCDEDE